MSFPCMSMSYLTLHIWPMLVLTKTLMSLGSALIPSYQITQQSVIRKYDKKRSLIKAKAKYLE